MSRRRSSRVAVPTLDAADREVDSVPADSVRATRSGRKRTRQSAASSASVDEEEGRSVVAESEEELKTAPEEHSQPRAKKRSAAQKTDEQVDNEETAASAPVSGTTSAGEPDPTSIAALAAAAGVSEYEYQRMQNIRLKQEQLERLNLTGLSGELGLLQRAAPVRAKSRPKEKRVPQVGMRRSSRSSVRDPNYVPPPPIYVPELSAAEMYKHSRKEGPLALKDAHAFELEEEDQKEYDAVLAAFDHALLLSDPRTAGLEKKALASSYMQPNPISLPKLRMLGEGVKMVKDRATVIRAHPTVSLTNDFTIVAAADKNGRLGLAKYENDASPSRWASTVQVAEYAPHVNSMVELIWSHADAHLLYSASRDGSVRRLDIEQRMFDEFFADDDDGVSGMGMAHDQDTLYVGNRDGCVHVVDARADAASRRKTSATHRVGVKAVNACVVSPVDPHLLVTGGLDRVVRAWDLRKMVADKPVQEWTHAAAINSVYFSPSGSMLASTSYDDTIKLWSCTSASGSSVPASSWLPPTIVRHDNQTGRWVTRFRAVFAPCEVALAIGDMRRPIDVITILPDKARSHTPDQSAPAAASVSNSKKRASSSSSPSPSSVPLASPVAGPLLKLHHSEWVTTIPAAVTWHPNRVQVIGCTGSGRLYVYGQTSKDE